MRKQRGLRIKTRVILTALGLLVAILAIFVCVIHLQNNFLNIFYAFEILSIITVLYIVNKRGNPNYKIAWIVFILVLPVFGLFIYMLWGGQRTFPHLKRKFIKCENYYLKYLEQDSSVKNLIDDQPGSVSRQAAFLTGESSFPVYKDTKVTYLAPGEVFFPRLLEELEKAEKYIFIEYFIIADGKMWEAIFNILKAKAQQGLEIKILFDDFGSIKRQGPNFIKRLKKIGIEVSVFCPIKPSLNMVMNNRNHRKIVVIDGNVAFTGGINIADEYINQYERFGYWMDCGIMLKGSAVDSFVVMFCTMWEYTTRKQMLMSKYLMSIPEESDSFAIPYSDSPMDSKNTAEGIYLQMLSTAHKYIDIATPYLILDDTMKNAIILTAKSGVNVRIITPFIPDKKYVHPVTQYYYSELLDAGVEIYEYTPGFIHSKIFAVDGNSATIGTVNMDYRSFFFHFECGVWFTDKNTIKDIRAHFNDMVKDSKRITPIAWNRRSLYERFKQWILHIFSPLM